MRFVDEPTKYNISAISRQKPKSVYIEILFIAINID